MLSNTQARRLQRIPLAGRPNRIADAMALAHVTQKQIEAATGIQQAYISALKRGDYSRLPIETARTLARFFGVSIEDLFPEPDAPKVGAR